MNPVLVHITLLKLITEGVGLTHTVKVNGSPTQDERSALGVTRYVAVC